MPPKNPRSNNFALLHILGAVMVMYGHCYPLLQAGPAPSLFAQVIHGLGIRVLFVISGYLSVLSLQRSKGYAEYTWKRISRIYPPYAAAILLSTFLLFFISQDSTSLLTYLWKAKKYAGDNLLFKIQYNIPGVFVDNPSGRAVNGSLWSLPVELVLQLLLPLLLWFPKRTSRRGWWCGALYGLFLSVTFVLIARFPGVKHIVWRTDWVWLWKLGAYYMGGAFFACISKDALLKICRIDLAFIIMIAAFIFHSRWPLWLTPCLLPYVVITAALKVPAWKSDFWNKYDIAYGLYLWAFPVQQTLIRTGLRLSWLNWTPYTLFLPAVIITGLLAYGQKKLIEEPLVKGRSSFRR